MKEDIFKPKIQTDSEKAIYSNMPEKRKCGRSRLYSRTYIAITSN